MAFNPRQQQGQPQPNRVEGMQNLQGIAQSRTLTDDARAVRGGIPTTIQQTPMAPQQAPMMQPSMASNIPTDPEKAEVADKVVKIAAWDGLLDRAGITEEQLNSTLASLMGNTVDEFKASKEGGLIGMAAGGNFQGQVQGRGHGMEDNVYMPIVERNRGQQVATLAVSPDEYVVDAHTMSALGNGSADAGAKVMDNVVDRVREKAYGTDQQPNEINGLAALRPMIERV